MIDARRSGNRLTRILDAITRFVGRAVAWLIVPMVASLVYEVIARYVFDAPTLSRVTSQRTSMSTHPRSGIPGSDSVP